MGDVACLARRVKGRRRGVVFRVHQKTRRRRVAAQKAEAELAACVFGECVIR